MTSLVSQDPRRIGGSVAECRQWDAAVQGVCIALWKGPTSAGTAKFNPGFYRGLQLASASGKKCMQQMRFRPGGCTPGCSKPANTTVMMPLST